MDDLSQKTSETPPPPLPTPYREELAVMETVANAFDGVDPACRFRVWRWIADRYGIRGNFFG